MTCLGTQDALTAFMSSMAAEGVIPVHSIANDLLSGELIRFECVGDKPGKRNGFAVLRLGENPYGAFGNWRTGTRIKWYASNIHELRGQNQNQSSRKYNDNKLQKQEKVAQTSVALWMKCRPADPSHPYLTRKGIQPTCIGQLGERLVVPLIDVNRKIWNLQFIAADGAKRFQKGGRVTGLFWVRPGTSIKTVCIGEGVGTMAAIGDATGNTVVAAFSASNLLPVTKLIAERYPDHEIVVCADNDRHLSQNVGLESARKAATLIGAWLAVAERQVPYV